MNSIAILGLGQMGSGIASVLLDKKFKVTVWNRTKLKAEELLSKGAQWAVTPAEAAEDAEAVISMVSDDHASSEIWFGPEGAFQTMKNSSFAIECSTLSALHVKKLSEETKNRGLRYIDCPVTGWPQNARNGSLTLLVGCDAAYLPLLEPLLCSFSTTIRHFGGVGTGTAYKLMINLMGAVQIAALAEGLAFAEKLGLDKKKVVDAIENSAAASPQVKNHVRKMSDRVFSNNSFTIGLRLKDALYGLSLAKSVNSQVSLGSAAAAIFAAANDNANRDEASIIEIM